MTIRLKLKLFFTILFPLQAFCQSYKPLFYARFIKEALNYADTNFHKRLLNTDGEFSFGQYAMKVETLFRDFKEDPAPNYEYTSQKEFDTEGRIVKEINGGYGGIIYSEIQNKYDPKGNLIQIEETAPESKSKITNYTYRYIYSKDKNVIACVQSNLPYTLSKYFYNKNLQIAELREYAADDQERRTNFKYDKEGRLIKEIKYEIEGALKKDKKGMEIWQDKAREFSRKEYFFNETGTLRQSKEGCTEYLVKGACEDLSYEYDDKKRKVRMDFSWMGSPYSYRLYSYNDDNTINKISWYKIKDTASKSYAEYFYNTQKLISKVVFYHFGQVVNIDFKYKFDSHNNWTEQTKLVNNKILYVRTRAITYWQ